MRRIFGSIAVAVLLAVPLVECSGQQSNQTPSGGGAQVGQTAPDFALPSADGGKVALSDFKGKPVLLYFSMGPG